MVTFLQRIFTSLVHAHAGRTQVAPADIFSIARLVLGLHKPANFKNRAVQGVICKQGFNSVVEKEFHFQLPFKAPVAIILLLCALVLSAYTGNPSYYYSTLPIIFVSLFSELFICKLVLSKNGMVYNHNKLVWSEVKSVTKTKFMWLPYLKIQRQSGMSWWVPLYYVGKSNIEQTLGICLPNHLANGLKLSE